MSQIIYVTIKSEHCIHLSSHLYICNNLQLSKYFVCVSVYLNLVVTHFSTTWKSNETERIKEIHKERHKEMNVV